MALQTAAPSCADDSSDRYVDCGNGTVTDNETGLVWLRDANCIGSATGGIGNPPGSVVWSTAMDFVAGLSDWTAHVLSDCGLEDGSSPGEWRLPSGAEWRAVVEYATALDCTSPPTIPSDSGEFCWSELCLAVGQCSFSGVVSDVYWTSNTDPANPAEYAGAVNLSTGQRFYNAKEVPNYVWPVRAGQ